MFTLKNLKAEEAFLKAKLKIVRDEIKTIQSTLSTSSSSSSSIHESKQQQLVEPDLPDHVEVEPEPEQKKKQVTPQRKKKLDCGSIGSFGGGKRPYGYVSFIVNYHHGRDEVEGKEDFRAPVSKLVLFYQHATNTPPPTYQQMINAVRCDVRLKEHIPGQTRNFIITVRPPPDDDVVFGRVMESAPVVMGYDKHHLAPNVVYDIWPYQVVNNAKPPIMITALVDHQHKIMSDNDLICTSKPWINELTKKRSESGYGYFAYIHSTFDKSREDGLRFRNMAHLSFSTKNSTKSGYVIYGMNQQDRHAYDAAHTDESWYNDEEDSEGMKIAGLPVSFFGSSSSSSSSPNKKESSKKRKRQPHEQEEEEVEEEKKQPKSSSFPESDLESDTGSDSGDELPNPKRPKTKPQDEEYDENNIDELPRIVDAGCNGTFTKLVKIVPHFIHSEKDAAHGLLMYPSLLSSKTVIPEPFAFVGDGKTTMKHLDAFATSHFAQGEYDIFSLGMGVRVSDNGTSYVLQPEPFVLDGGVYHYYFFAWPGSVPIVSQVRITPHLLDWTVVDFNFVCCKELSDAVLDSFPDHGRFDWVSPICYLINGLSIDEKSNNTRVEHVTSSRVHSMRTKYQLVMGKQLVFLVIVPKLLTLEQSSVNTDLKGALEQQNRYHHIVSTKQQEIEEASQPQQPPQQQLLSMDQPQ